MAAKTIGQAVMAAFVAWAIVSDILVGVYTVELK
jgi:hypothetical protein